MLAVWKVWSAPSYPEIFQGTPHRNIILCEYLHSIHCSENEKKIFSSLFFINIFAWTYIFMQWTDLVGHLNLSAVFTRRVFKSELIGLRQGMLVLLRVRVSCYVGRCLIKNVILTCNFLFSLYRQMLFLLDILTWLNLFTLQRTACMWWIHPSSKMTVQVM
jgi:hypothetical protein